MKKLLFVLLILVSLLIAFAPLLPKNRIIIKSEVPISCDDIFFHFGGLYFTYLNKIDVPVKRSFMKVEVSYEPEPILNIKFTDGIRGLTSKGFLISKMSESNDVLTVNASANLWPRFMNLYLELNKMDLISEVKSFEIYQNKVAFFNKKGILIITGEYNLKDSLVKLTKSEKIIDEKGKLARIIDLEYEGQSIIIWR